MTLANELSLFRILITPFFVSALIYFSPQHTYFREAALILFSLAALSDLIDGFIARRFKQKTAFGAIIDPLADKILLISAFITLASIKTFPAALKLPTWLPIIVISRDAVIILGIALIHTLKKEFEIFPTILGKLTTFFQMMTVISVIARFNFAPVVWTMTAVFTVVSGIQYIKRGLKVLNEENLK